MGRKHISTVSQLIDASTNDSVEITDDAEIDKDMKKPVSWAGVVKGGKCVNHTHKKEY